MVQPHYGFLDESPALPDPDHFFVVALVCAQAPLLKSLRRIPKRVRTRVLGKQLRQVPELKFYNSDDRVRRWMLEMVVQYDVQLVVYRVDKAGRSVEDTPDNYGVVVGSAVAAYLQEIYPQLALTVDKKYTSPAERARFDRVVNQLVSAYAPHSTFALTAHVESQGESLVQLADFVAGAVHQRFNRGIPDYFEMIRPKVVLERAVSWVEVKAAALEVLGEEK